MSAHARQNSGIGILLYGHRDTDCFRRPFLTTPARGVAPSTLANSSRLVLFMKSPMVNPARALQLAPLVIGRSDGKLAGRIEPAEGEPTFKKELELDAHTVAVMAQQGVDRTLLLADAPEALTRVRHMGWFPAPARRVDRLRLGRVPVLHR
jgi:hypothetical protein